MKLKKYICEMSCIILILLIICHAGGLQLVKNQIGITSDNFSKITVTFYENTATMMGITWYTPSGEEYGSDIQLFYASSKQLVDVLTDAKEGINTNDASWEWHQVVLSQLEPDKKYMYRVGDAKKNCWSKMGSFSTGNPNNNEFEFIALTDTQGDAEFSASAMRSAIATVPNAAFLMHSGDFVDDGGKEELWTYLINASSDVLMNIPIVPAVGSHVTTSDAFWQHFNLDAINEDKTTGLYYSLDYGNVHLAVLNTNESDANDTSYLNEKQLQWLDRDLAEARAGGCNWIIVNMHRGPYTVGNHADDTKYEGKNGMRVRLGAILEKYEVSLVIEGHDHIPCVTYGIMQGKKTDSNSGVVYMDTGAAGPKVYALTNKMPASYLDLFRYIDTTDRASDVYQDFADIQVQKNKIHVILYEINTTLVDHKLSILYEFDIEK